MFAKLKVTKRRLEEKVLQATGIAQGSTTDEEFSRAEAEFHVFERRLVDIGVQVKTVIDSSKAYTHAMAVLSDSLKVMHTPADPEETTSNHPYSGPSGVVSFQSNYIDNHVNASITHVLKERVLDPIMKILTNEFPAIKAKLKERADTVIDYDSHKRKVLLCLLKLTVVYPNINVNYT